MIEYFRSKAQLKKERDLAYQIAEAYRDILMFAEPENLVQIQEFLGARKDDPNIDQIINNMITASEILI